MNLDTHDSASLTVPAGPVVTRPPRLKAAAQRLKLSDPAERAMTNLPHDGPEAVGEQCCPEAAKDEMFRWGARALLVRRDRLVVGVLTADDFSRQRVASAGCLGARPADRVADLMTRVDDPPSLEWRTVRASVRNVLDLFERSGARLVLVVDTGLAAGARVRGLFQRDRLDRQLGFTAHP